MAEEKAVAKKEKATKKKAKRDTFKWFRELKSEFKKIVWPTGKQVKNNTIVVLVMVFLMAGAIFVFDWGFNALLNKVIIPGDDDFQYTQPDDEETGDEETGEENTDGENNSDENGSAE